MKSIRIPNLQSQGANKSVETNLRALSPEVTTKINGEVQVEDISDKISECFSDDDGVTLRLKDEFAEELVLNVIKETRAMISENTMTSENWKAIGEFLSNELWEFSRLKEDLVLAERKCGMVQQKASEISLSGDADQIKTSLMACAMLFAETKMRRDNLADRISMIIDQFVTKILGDFTASPAHTGLELRLRAVFGSL